VVEHRHEHCRVEALIGEGQLSGVGANRVQALGRGVREHLRRAVGDDRLPFLFDQRERVVACAAADVEQLAPRRRRAPVAVAPALTG
jgi:hypothetical protein